jgi:hypothetical protein
VVLETGAFESEKIEPADGAMVIPATGGKGVRVAEGVDVEVAVNGGVDVGVAVNDGVIVAVVVGEGVGVADGTIVLVTVGGTPVEV